VPHAGGSPGLYRSWPALFPADVELLLACPPGREDRLDDPFPPGLPVMASDLADALVPELEVPWAVFGHSMGAAVAHELVLEMLRRGGRPPEHVFVSAREAPQHHHGGDVHTLRDDELCAELVRLGGTHQDLLEIPELRGLVLPAVRADYRLIETYRPDPVDLLPCPVTALIGRQDEELTQADADGWRAWTSGPFELLAFPGRHFYLSERPQEVVAAVVERIGARAAGPR
jgi:surfactin synthase thioesterase subunit